MCARDQSSIFSAGGKFHPDYGLPLELHTLTLTLVACSYAMLCVMVFWSPADYQLHVALYITGKMFWIFIYSHHVSNLLNKPTFFCAWNSIPHLLVTLKTTVEPNSLYNLMKVINLNVNTVPISQSPQCSWWGLVLAEMHPVQWVVLHTVCNI